MTTAAFENPVSQVLREPDVTTPNGWVKSGGKDKHQDIFGLFTPDPASVD